LTKCTSGIRRSNNTKKKKKRDRIRASWIEAKGREREREAVNTPSNTEGGEVLKPFSAD